MTISETIISHPTKELSFDWRNPRLPEFGLQSTTSEKEMIKVLWDAMDVKELVLSIAASGFFPHEPIIVAEENDQKIVIEGNRRLAAVKTILDPKLIPEPSFELPEITPEKKESLETLPIIIETRESAWKYMGFKHVNGPAKWGSFAKSKYIAQIYRKYNIPLEDIARQIGDTHKTVQRLFHGLMVLEEAEKYEVFNRDDRAQSHFSFSHLYTGLSYEGVRSFLSLRDESEETDEPVPKEKIENLGEFLLWLYGSKSEEISPVVQTQNPDLRYLNSVLEDLQALAALRKGVSLSECFEISRPASIVFEEALLEGKRSLQKARAMLSEGYGGSEALMRIAGSIADLADDLYEEMQRKFAPKNKERMTEEGK